MSEDDEDCDPLLTPPAEESNRAKERKQRPTPSRGSDDDAGASLGSRSQPNGLTVNVATSADNYRCLLPVGKGKYGRVYKAETVRTKEIVACKVAASVDCPVLKGFPLSLVREIGIMRKLQDCKSIVRLIEVVASKTGSLIIVMEYCQASLLELLQSEQHALLMGEVKFITRQILDGVCYMHSLGILHRDLATKNILFNQSGEIKVCDFGISRIGFSNDPAIGLIPAPDLEPPYLCVSLHYRSIELCLGETVYGPALDVWSVGCILAEILISQAGRRQPFFGGIRENPNKTPQMVVETCIRILGKPSEASWPGVTNLSGWKQVTGDRQYQAHRQRREEKSFLASYFTKGEGRPVMSKYMLTDASFDLLAGMLTMYPADRSSSKEALESAFFREKPFPEWHAWHWATSVCQIDQRKDFMDSTETLKRQINEQEKEQKKAKIQQAVNLRRDARRDMAKAEEAPLRDGWSKIWSKTKKRYYYHHNETGVTQWERPS